MTAANFEGHQPRECDEHRTVGPHRAWCLSCTEWCYPNMEAACVGCQVPYLKRRIERALELLQSEDGQAVGMNTDEGIRLIEALRLALTEPMS